MEITVGSKFKTKHKDLSIIDRTIKISPILERIDVWLRKYKPIHLCWLFDKLGLPIPRYFIGMEFDEVKDSWSEATRDAATYVNALHPTGGANTSAAGQAFVASSTYYLTRAKFFMKKNGSPTGTAHVRLYAATGTPGSGAKPTGAALASSPGFEVSTLPTDYGLIEFDFSADLYELQNGVAYCIVFENPSSGTINTSNYCPLGRDNGGGHAGNACQWVSGAWAHQEPKDANFYVYGLTIPSAPSNCVASYVATNNAKCTWNDNSDKETGFRIEKDIDGAGFSFWKNVNPGIEDSGTYTLGANHRIRFRVRAYNGVGSSTYSTSGYTYTIPTAPSGINLSWLAQDETVRVAWTDNSAYEQDFDVEKATDGGGYGHLVYDAASPYDDTAPSGNDHRYIYRVRARCPDGRLSGWNTASAYIFSTPTAPSNCAIALGTINVTWTDNSTYEDGFEVDRQLDGGGWGLVHTTAAEAESWGDSSQPTGANVKYEYRVRAKIGSIYSTYSTSNVIFIKAFSESIALSDAYLRVWSIYRTFTESISLSDVYLRLWSIYRTFRETITLSDLYSRVWTRFRTFIENISLADTLQKKPAKIFTESITLTDFYSRVWSIYRTFTETLSLADTLIKKPIKTFIENLHLADTLIKRPAKIFSERITLADTLKKRVHRIFTETLSLTDTVSKKAVKTFLETLHLQDRYTRVVSWYRTFTEKITLIDTVKKVKSNLVQLFKKLMNLFDIEG